ncbi:MULTISPECIES: phosphotransferase enzyme family protein [Stenotrophomonas]|uniref:Aminoglycoside phosphotransferase n=1 Tax=Stenotrophomonas nitritireducens TaxID=83617 RepID=A0ABR5NJC7_9GAMM|nr:MULTISPECIES: phosphotransferase [Stenotrophomonas]KQO00157.1 aminoglycoside phosphotransferase [Stenotrophomonas sp. Leaf70]KRG56940.1 aminoglycoside phosphotransferase [Stenotrophomonas nitritireducens]
MTASSHRVQGLANDEVPADWPAISGREIAWLRGRFSQLEGADTALWHSPRPMSAAAIVEGAAGRLFVKRHHHSVRDAATLGEEHRFIAHLAAAGVPVVQVLRDRDGFTAVEHEGWTYELHTLGIGEDLYRDAASWTPLTDVAQARDAGRMLARLHQAAASYHAPQRGTHLLVARDDLIRSHDPIAALKADLGNRPGLARYLARIPWEEQLRRTVLPWHAGLPERLRAEPRLWAHNDWHVSNLLWRDGAVSTVLDFGLASPTSALFDLATAIERNAVAWLELERGAEAVRIDIALALLDGYRQVLPLSPARVHLLADLLPVVHLDFALSEVEYFEGITGSTANADVAWQPFLLGHAQWFRSAEGQALLAALHAAA